MTSRKLDKIASDLDDMSVTLEEIKDQIGDTGSPDHAQLNKIHSEVTRAADQIDTLMNLDDAEIDLGKQVE
jgi:hypothetical protein